MAKEKMSQTQTSTKYAEPPIKINRALYGVLLASLASVFWGSMGVCVQYIFRQLPAFFYSLPRGSLKTATVA